MVATTLLLSGCALNSDSNSASQDGVGTVRIAPAKRDEPIEIAGQTLTGKSLSTQTMNGMIVVNAWASWCRNCIFEWKDLQALSQAYPNVHFLGLNESDSKSSAQAFLKSHPSEYQHLFDHDNRIFNKLPGLPSLSIPMTLVLDAKHRVAARIMGRVDKQSVGEILSSLSTER